MVMAETQLKEIAGQIKAKVNVAITHIKKNTSSTPIDPNAHSTSQSSADSSPTEERTLSAVFQALFASCTGNNWNDTDAPPPVNSNSNSKSKSNININTNNTNSRSNNNRHPTKLGKKAKSALHNLQQKNSGSRDECHYAQYYSDDHGKAARAVLMTRKREEQERLGQRQKLNEMHSKARQEAGMRFQMNGGDAVKKSPNKGKNTEQHREHIRVGGNHRLCEVGNGLNRSSASEDSESALSYNYDDGISAISAHTLDEMAKADMIFQKKIGIPKEEGFDVTLDSTGSGVASTPSLNSTADSSDASEDVAKIQDLLEDHSAHKLDVKAHPVGGRGNKSMYPVQMARGSSGEKTMYPVQMARPRSQRSGGSTESSTQSDHSEWKNQDAKYWMQVAEEDTNRDGPVSERTSMLFYCFGIVFLCASVDSHVYTSPMPLFIHQYSQSHRKRNVIPMIRQFALQARCPFRRKRKVASLERLNCLEDERNTWYAMMKKLIYSCAISSLGYCVLCTSRNLFLLVRLWMKLNEERICFPFPQQ
jgi:hypothetical protein